MNTAGRLGIYGAGLVVVFGAAFAAAGVIVPDSAVASWTERGGAGHDEQSAEEAAQNTENGKDEAKDVSGVTIAASGYTLGAITAPGEAGVEGELSFEIRDVVGDALTAYETAHGKQLHLIVVRSDGSEYRHVHPVSDAQTGTWSLQWTWDAAGTVRPRRCCLRRRGIERHGRRLRRPLNPPAPLFPRLRREAQGSRRSS